MFSKLCRALRVVRLVLSDWWLVGLVKYLLKELAISLLVLAVVLLKLMERLGSLVIGSLLLSDFIVFQYVVWLFLWSHVDSM